jgi:hypothetical protein
MIALGLTLLSRKGVFMGLKEELLNKRRLNKKTLSVASFEGQTVTDAPVPAVSGLGHTTSKQVFSEIPESEHATTLAHMPPVTPFWRKHVQPYVPSGHGTGRTRDGKWRNGASGNPDGSPLGFVAYIRLMTADAQELVDHALLCLRGWILVRWQDERDPNIEHERLMPADPKYQSEARAWLADRGYGKALQVIETKSDDGPAVNYAKLTTDELRTFLALQAKATAEDEAIEILPASATQAEGRTNEEIEDAPTVTLPLPQLAEDNDVTT